MHTDVTVLIMAAGEGTRMKSDMCKVMHKVCGYPVIEYVMRAAERISSLPPVVIVGHKAEEIEKYLSKRALFEYQRQRLGTGHAVMIAKGHLKPRDGYVVVLAGDVPLISADTLQSMIDYCLSGGYGAVTLAALLDDPAGYGRIIRNSVGDFERIVEHKDASEFELEIKEVNASIYCFNVGALLDGLEKLDRANAQGEYYLTDVLAKIVANGDSVGVLVTEYSDEIMGINTRVQLAQAQRALQAKINSFHMDNGVTIIDPDNTYIGPDVVIGRDTVIYPGNVLEGRVIIGEKCELYPNNRIVDSKIDRNCVLQSSVVSESVVEADSSIGPCAHIRPGSFIGKHVRVGNFVEVKNCSVGDNSKVSHLSYVGDGQIGKDVNVGCGVVFVNFDGEKKHKTLVGDRSFIGCNVNLVAPITVEDDTYVAAGSTITHNVPSGSLAIARERQVNKQGWVEKRKTHNKGAEV
jgi:bifunctional UDP-N-acetylglucosamine pyrophosphorylase/glucosamine-1-phosphate N-acetyltransferase